MITNEERAIIVHNIENLLSEYGYNFETNHVYEIVDKWAENKSGLIELFKKHPNYIDGKFMIAFDADFERNVDINAINNFFNYVTDTLVRKCVETLPEDVNQQRIEQNCVLLPSEMYDWFTSYRITNQFITQEHEEIINQVFPFAHAHKGQKTSRIMNKIFTYLGYNKHPDYNREFAKYADALNPLTIKRHTVISINPIDYLTMSFGNSWASCHTIDKENKRGMPHNYSGCYSSGTLSYMLDEVSMVFYTVDAAYNGNDYFTQPKINRQMFHYGESKLIQGRLYPQDNDDNAEGYTAYRNIVQNIMAQVLDVPNLWTLKKGTEAASRYIKSYGTHYHDYTYYDNCTLSMLKGVENEENIIVGHRPICPNCGDYHNNEENILCTGCDGSHHHCSHCGCVIDEDDIIWIGYEPYCRDCVFYCDNCGSYEAGEGTYIRSTGETVCDDCLNEYYTYCEECEEWYWNGDCNWVDSEEKNVCYKCLKQHYTKCDECGEYFKDSKIENINGYYYCHECAERIRNESDED